MQETMPMAKPIEANEKDSVQLPMKASAFDHYLAEDVLKNGNKVIIRAIKPEDKPILQEGMHHLSRESIYSRFFSVKRELSPDELTQFTELDFVHHVGLLASVIKKRLAVPVGVGRYIMPSDEKMADTAEVAFAVDERFQGQGIGKLLMKHLTIIAREQGLKQFVAYVLPDNFKMQAVFAASGLPLIKKTEQGLIKFTMSLADTSGS